MFRRARLSVKPNPAESTAAPPAGLGGAQPPEKAPRSSDEKPDGENVVEESGKSSSTVSQRKKRVSRTPTLVKPSVSVPSEPHPLSPVNKEAPQPDPVPAKEKQPCSDRYRIYKAQKLREMLKEELRKEKKQWKNKCAINESQRPPDRSKMTMRDFIYYLPDNNPMTSSLEQEKKTEKSLTPVQTREQESKSTPEAEDEDEVEEEMDEGPLLVPRVKVAEDGSIILDEESLTVEVLRTKGPCVVEENDPIFERGSTTTYSSFRKNYYSKPWSNKETDMFFLAISMVGTDFSMIGQLFPHRARIEIKNKFKREEKTNGWRIDKAFQEKRPFDFDFFAHLLQKVLAEEEKRKQKSVKNQSLKEKKSSKPRKNVKVKKVASEGVNDDAAESVSTKIPDPEGSQKDAQTAGEEEESLTLSGQDSEQIVLEPNLNQNKRRRKTQDEVGKQEVQNLSGNATVQSGPSKGEKHKDKCQSSRPEINEGEGNKEQKLSCVQNIDDVVDLSSSEKVEEKTDCIVSLSSQPDAVSVAAETPGSSTSDLPSSEVGIRALCEVNDAENSCTEGRHADLKNKSPETDQRENVKPVARGRLQRPKPNLSRAIGKKPAISQGKTDAESESLHPETSMEKNHLEKDKRNTFDISETENTEGENPEAETVSNSSEKICLQEDDQPKAFRPTRLTRGRLRRPKPNVGKAAERKEILPSQEKIGANVENSANESSVDRGTPEQIEDQSCQNVECEDITSQSEEKGTSFQNVQPDEPTTLNECVSIQEDNKANTLKQVPMVKTRFQKPKPNVGRGIGRRKIFSKEEVSEEILTSGEMTTALREVARLGASPRENGPVEANTTEEMKSDLTETERRGVSPMEKTPEMIDITVDMETGLDETGRGVSLRDRVPEVTAATEERKTDLEENGRRELSLEEKAPEVVSTVGDMETGLEETGRGVSPRDKVPEVTDAAEERKTDLEENGRREISLEEKASEAVSTIGDMETGLEETGRGVSLRDKVPEVTDATEERKTDLEESGREISLQEKTPEAVSTVGDMETGLEETGRGVSTRDKVPEVTDATEERQTDLEESGREISLEEKAPEAVSTIDDVETGLKETGRGVSTRDKVPEVTDATEERKTDLEESGREISLEEKAPEAVSTIDDVETGLKETGRGVSPRDKVLVGINAIGGKEVDSKETGKGAISLTEKVLGKTTAVEETQADLEETGREISLRKSRSEETSTTEEMVADLEKTGKIDISLRGNVPEETGISRQTETDLMESIRAVGSALPSLNLQNIGSEALLVVPVPGEEERSSEKEGSSQLSHLKTSSQTPELGETEDQGMLSPDAPERFSDANLSKSLPQEQKPLEVKPAPFVRSRFKRPKPNLARAALKREMTETGMSVPGKKLETGKTETGVIQQSREQTNMLPSQHDVAFLMTSREKDGSGPRPEEAVVSPCVQIEKDLSSPSFCEPVEESQAARAQGEEGVVSVRTQNINTFQQEMKESVTQTAPSVRGRLQRPRPNIRKAGQRQRVEKGEAEGIVEEERTVVQKDETEKKFLTGANFQIGTEVEVVPSKVSEGGMSENQSHVVLVGNLPVNKVSVLDEKTRHEHETCVPGPAQLIRRRFQKAGPNLGRAHGEKEAAAVEEDRAEQSKAKKPEDDLLDQEDSDTQLLQKEKAEFLTSLAVSARKDSVGSREAVWAKKDAESSRAAGDKSASSGVEEQHLSKLTSCPQLLKESDYSKIALDQRTTVSSASECEGGRSERRTHRKSKPNVTKGRGSKRIRTKTSKKGPRASRAVLVTLRASQEEDEDDTEDFECDYEEETYHLAPEEVNKAPVFVPVGLRSPEPVSAQIEETMEELEITVNVPDVGCITVDEPQLLHTDAATQEMKQGDLNSLSLEMTTGGHTPDETGANDGSTEAAITLLTMGDLVLQSEISTEQSDVGVCVLPDGHSKDKSHIPFSPDNVDHRIVHECQELPSAVNSASPSLEENKIVLEEQSSKEESGLVENVKENTVPARNATSEVTGNLRMRSRLAEPKPNLRILGTRRFGAHQEVPGLFVTKGEEVDIQRETEKNVSKATELEDKNLGSVTTAESKEQSRSARVHGIEESSVSKEAQLTGRNEDQEEGCHEGRTLSVAPVVSFETRPHAFGLAQGLHEGAVEEALRKGADGDGVLTLRVPQCTPASIPEVQQENVIPPQDLTVNLVANMHQDGEEEQAFILTLVEIPTSAVEEFTDPTVQLTPSPLLPAPILVRSVSTEERGDMSMSFPVASVGQDAMCLSDSGREDSEEPPASLDLVSRKRFHCRLDDSDHVPPAKKSALLSRDTCQKYTSEVCSKELINVFEETGEPFRGQGVFPPSGRTHTTPEPQKEQLESAFQSLESRCLDKVTDTHIEKNTPQIPQAERTVSDKDEGSCAAPKSEQMDSIASSSKAPLSRPGRRPLGFLSLICSKNGLESDEPSQVHSKKRLKPLIPVSRQSLKRSNPPSEGQKKIQESSALLPSPKVVVDTQSENTGGSAAQVSCDHPLPKEEGKSVRNRAPEGEPTTVSEYFFSDIFIEVDETE
uniref:B double prime 1, subunit of RNA polymerase III transcription initiation factor IIIB n=1 Tax=Equus caballus TaxID=9796 RepID=A0A9L0SCB6_HORSE